MFGFEIDFLKSIEQIRTEGLNKLFELITMMGEEMLMILLILVIWFAFDKRTAQRMFFITAVSGCANSVVKCLCKVPRPFTRGVACVRPDTATGYSFPSGHTQNFSSISTVVAILLKKVWVWIVVGVLILLVAFSRMYLGVHTLLDVGVSLLISAVTLFVLFPVFDKGYERPRVMYITIGVMALLAISNLLFVMLFPFPADVDPVNLADAQKVAWQMAFLVAGMSLIYPIDRKFIKFDTHAVWWAQILKVILGLGAVLAVKEGLRAPLEALFAGHLAARAVRYFLIVVVAGIVWPLSFRWFGKLGRKEE